jgi:hypothetical protein
MDISLIDHVCYKMKDKKLKQKVSNIINEP